MISKVNKLSLGMLPTATIIKEDRRRGTVFEEL